MSEYLLQERNDKTMREVRGHIKKAKRAELEAQLTQEAAEMLVCMYELLIERHGWKEDELAEEIRRMVKEQNKKILQDEMLKSITRQNGGVWQ